MVIDGVFLMRFEDLVQIPTELIVKKFFEEHKEVKSLNYSMLAQVDSLLTHTYKNMQVSFDLSRKGLERVVAESNGALILDAQGIERGEWYYYNHQKQIVGGSEAMRKFASEKLYAALKNYTP